MIVLIDIKSLTIKIYTENGMKSIPFEEADLLKDMLRNRKVIYVTNATVTTADNIIQTVGELQKQRSKMLQKAGEPMYLRSTLPGPLNIQNIRNKNTGKKEIMKFTGPFDGLLVEELISDFGEELFKRNKTIRSLLKKGRLQILGESEFEDQRERYKSGELKLKSLKNEYVKYMKLLSKEESEDEILFDITKSTKRMAATGGRQSSSRDGNETTMIEGISTWDSF